MSWSENRGTRQIIDGSASFIDIMIEFRGDVGDTPPARGVTLASIDATAGTLISTGHSYTLIKEPTVHSVQAVHRDSADASTSRINVRFRGWKKGA